MIRISPVLLLVIVILAAIFFAYGLLHLLVRYLIKIPSFSSISQSNRNRETSSSSSSSTGSQVFQRQLQQLFLLHDSGVDQALIETLPIFYYKDIIITGLKEPFDCAVCLCEFSDSDVLRLLPLCGHAFHIQCIDTWLLSNSTCPLCRNLIISSGICPKLSNFNESASRIMRRDPWHCLNEEVGNTENHHNNNSGIVQENGGEMRVFSIRLGKFRNINEIGSDKGITHGEEEEEEEEVISRCNLDGRRCYSMGTYEYVLGSEVQIALSNNGRNRYENQNQNQNQGFCNNQEKDGKKISARTRGESYSVSKIWLWSKKDSCSSVTNNNNNIVV